MSINNAFLNDIIHEIVFMKQPEGFEDPYCQSHVCKLNKALYGLKQALRAWYDKLKQALFEKDCQNSVSDTSLFILKQNSHMTYVLIYVNSHHWFKCFIYSSTCTRSQQLVCLKDSWLCKVFS